MFNDFSLRLLGLLFLENVYSMQTEEAGVNVQARKLNLQERVLVVGKLGEFFLIISGSLRNVILQNTTVWLWVKARK